MSKVNNEGRGRLKKRKSSPTRYPQVGELVKINIKPYNPPNYHTGVVAKVLTKNRNHSRGFKVRLTCGTIGRVVEIISTWYS